MTSFPASFVPKKHSIFGLNLPSKYFLSKTVQLLSRNFQAQETTHLRYLGECFSNHFRLLLFQRSIRPLIKNFAKLVIFTISYALISTVL